MRFDRDIFFDNVRSDPFDGALSQQQVDGMNSLLSVWERYRPDGDIRHLAYLLATDVHETAWTCQPIAEYGKGSGHEYGKVDPETGQIYYGRGLVMITWRDNYARADKEILTLFGYYVGMELEADKAMKPPIAIANLIIGCEQGWYTGKKLSDYFNEDEDDPVNARQIVNGNDKDTLIAGYHADFMTALALSQIPEDALPPLPEPDEPPARTMVSVNVQASADADIAVFVNGEAYKLAQSA